MKKLFKSIKDYFRHPWFKIMDPLENTLRKHGLSIDRCDDWAMATVFAKSKDPIRVEIRYESGYLVWFLNSPPGHRRDFCGNAFISPSVDLVIDELLRKTQKTFPDSSGKFYHDVRGNVNFEIIGKTIAEALFFASTMTTKLLPVMKVHSKKRGMHENNIEAAKKELAKYDEKCKKRIQTLMS